MKDYKKIERIGEGSYGTVYKCYDESKECFVALKEITFSSQQFGIPPDVLRELTTLRELEHPNIVKLLDFDIQKNMAYFVLEYSAMDFCKYLHVKNTKPIDQELTVHFMWQLTNALLFCHRRGIMHRDLKPSNILIDENNCVKLADFGFARPVDMPCNQYSSGVTTLWYRSPEVLLGATRYTCAIDIWSLGCIFAEMSTMMTFFKGGNEIDQLLIIFEALGTPTDNDWPSIRYHALYRDTFPRYTGTPLAESTNYKGHALDLLTEMLIYDPEKRISAKAMIRHKYFEEYKQKNNIVSE